MSSDFEYRIHDIITNEYVGDALRSFAAAKRIADAWNQTELAEGGKKGRFAAVLTTKELAG